MFAHGDEFVTETVTKPGGPFFEQLPVAIITVTLVVILLYFLVVFAKKKFMNPTVQNETKGKK